MLNNPSITHRCLPYSQAVQERLDEYGIIRLINYIRSEVAAGKNPLPVLAAGGSSGAVPWLDDQYLVPTMKDDAMLSYDFEDVAATAAGTSMFSGTFSGCAHVYAL